MPVMVRVGAVHLGWDVVSVAAGGGGTPIRPVQVEGTYTPPAYLLADASGRLHTARAEKERPELGMAIADVRDILGHAQIVIAGATWPAELVFRARLYNPLASIGQYLRGKPDVVALPFPDGWPDAKVDAYCDLVEQLDVTVEPLPESVALSGYVRALGLVRAPDQRHPHGVGATGVYSDGRTMLVVAVHGDDEHPTESVDVPVSAEAMRDARSADNVVIEVMAAARSIGADTSTVLLCGNVCFNDALRFAFQNHLGHRLQVADHPMHALVLGASHLLVTDNDAGEPESSGRHAERESEPPQQQAPPQAQGGVQQPPAGPPVVTYGPGYPTQGSAVAPEPPEEPTTRITRGQVPSLPPGLDEMGGRFDRPPGQHPTVAEGEAHAQLMGGRPSYSPPPHPGSGSSRQVDDESDKSRKGKKWGKMFGAHTAVGALALAAFTGATLGPAEDRIDLAGSVLADRDRSNACSVAPHAIIEQRGGVTSARRIVGQGDERIDADPDCVTARIDTLRYAVPRRLGVDLGPQIRI